MVGKNRTATNIINSLIDRGIERNASDIHFLPQKEFVLVKMRIDGLLEECERLDLKYHHELVARLKVLAVLRSDEHFRPQDGRFSYEDIDVRLSIVPTYWGENAVLRLLQNSIGELTFEDLGFSDKDAEKIRSVESCRSGMILFTGPTGSGKSSTLYALLKKLARNEISVVTLEDPVEYALSAITQVQVNQQTGLDFAHILRAVLRQDPDIIMVGEIRDRETARVAINAALTGHLIISTLHTKDSVSVLPRLVDMGIEPYLIASAVKIIVAQRLVRKLTDDGFKGRAVIAEVLTVSPEIVSALNERKGTRILTEIAKKEGMTTMFDDGKEKVEKGLTTLTEVFRVIHE